MIPMYPTLSRSITKQLWFLMDMNMVLHEKMSPTHRRTGLSQGIEVKFSEDMALVLKKEVFLANKKNKQRFINILEQKLEDAGLQ